MEEALTCYENALKYDPGNLSYEQNRDQIVTKAFKKISPPEEDRKMDHQPEGLSALTIPYQKFLIPAVVLIFVATLAVYLLIIPSFFGSHSPSPSHPITPVPTVVPDETSVPSENETQAGISNETVSGNEPDPSNLAGGLQPTLVISGDLNGKYTKGLSELTFTIVLTDGSQPQYLPRVSYLWAAGTMDPVTVLPANPASGTIKPGDEQEVTLQIDPGKGPTE